MLAIDYLTRHSGEKMGHWIWYIWPTLKMVRHTNRPELILGTFDDCRAYLRHPVLGARLVEITRVAVDKLRQECFTPWIT